VQVRVPRERMGHATPTGAHCSGAGADFDGSRRIGLESRASLRVRLPIQQALHARVHRMATDTDTGTDSSVSSFALKQWQFYLLTGISAVALGPSC